MKGGIVGGSIITGILKIGDNIEIRPGEISRNQNGQFICTSIQSRIVTLKAGKNPYNPFLFLIMLINV
jgi:translation initiation factor 2 subunit 3